MIRLLIQTAKVLIFLILASSLSVILYKGVKLFLIETGLSHFDPDNESVQTLFFRKNFKKNSAQIQAPAEYNSDKTYPLIIALHGWTEDENYYFHPWVEEKKNTQQYPCFYFAPNNTTEGWNEQADWVRTAVSELIKTYPVDKNRVYIIGFSMGGSGSFTFSETLYRDYGIMTAAIIRCAGMSHPILPEPLFSETALWYNAGSRDSLEGVYETFRESEKYYSENSETTSKEENDLIPYKNRMINRTTLTLIDNKRGKNKYRFSFFSPMGHEYSPVFASYDAYNWLFLQSLRDD
jgi:predicted peptidase